MKSLLAVLVVVALAAVPAYAIDLNSSVSDWNSAGLLHTGVRHASDSVMGLVAWGVKQEGDVLYAILQNDASMYATAPPEGGRPYDATWAGFWVDADKNVNTHLTNAPYAATYAWMPPDGGSEVCLEYDTDTPTPNTTYWWGRNDDICGPVDDAGEIAPTAAWKFSTTVEANDTIALSVPVADLAAKIYEYNHPYMGDGTHADTLGATYNVGVRLSGHRSDAGFENWWGGDTGTFMVTVPEPGTVAMLIGAGLALLGYALRRRG